MVIVKALFSHVTREKKIVTPSFKKWSKAAQVLMASALMSLVLCFQAFALTGAEIDRLVPVIIAAESSGNPRAIGPNGERGLMQISPFIWSAFSDFWFSEALDPEKNVQVGRRFLEYINDAYGRIFNYEPDLAHIAFTYNTGQFWPRPLPAWTKEHPNRIYRRIFNAS